MTRLLIVMPWEYQKEVYTGRRIFISEISTDQACRRSSVFERSSAKSEGSASRRFTFDRMSVYIATPWAGRDGFDISNGFIPIQQRFGVRQRLRLSTTVPLLQTTASYVTLIVADVMARRCGLRYLGLPKLTETCLW